MKNFKLIGLVLLLAVFQVVSWGQVTQIPAGSTGGGAPSGVAGGKLSGTYPDPGLNAASTDLSDTAVLGRKYFGTTAPGSVTGNLPGDLFSDTTNHFLYQCNAPSGTAAPACTMVAAGGWTKIAAFAADGSLVMATTVLGPKTIGAGATQLPAAASCSGCITIVTDAASAADCTVGSGSSIALCRSTGAVWAALGGGGGAPTGAAAGWTYNSGTNTITAVAGATVAIGTTVLIDSGNFASFAQACTAANLVNATLMVSKVWTGLSTQSCAANLRFPIGTGGSTVIDGAAGQTVTLTGNIDAGLYQIFGTTGTISLPRVSHRYPEWWGAVADGVTEGSSAIQAAINSTGWAGAGYMAVEFSQGDYKVTSTLTVANGRTTLEGAGKAATMITFAPAGTASLFKFTNGASPIVQCTIRGMGMRGTNAQTKTAVEAIDVSEFTMEDIAFYPWTGGTGSTAFSLAGRQQIRLNNVDLWADIPIAIHVNPNSYISIDHATFNNLYLVGDAAHPLVTIDTGVNLSNVHFTGGQAWALGTYGLYWVDTTTSIVSYNLDINNVRWEQAASGWGVYISHNTSMQNLNVRDSVFSGAAIANSGIYLRNTIHSRISSVIQVGNQTCLDIASSTNDDIGIDNLWCAVSGATVSTSGATNLRGNYTISTTRTDVVLPSAAGGTANGFFTVSGPASSAKTYTFPNASSTMAYTVASGATALNTAEIAANSSAVLKQAVATGVLTTDVVSFSPNAPIVGVTGYTPNGTLAIVAYPGIGLLSGTYTSGITTTGTVGQTCVLTMTNGGGAGATATVALSDTDTIAGSTALVVTANGTGFTSAPTTASVAAGTASACSGTATVATATSGYVNFDVMNKDQADAVTPGAVTLNWRITR